MVEFVDFSDGKGVIARENGKIIATGQQALDMLNAANVAKPPYAIARRQAAKALRDMKFISNDEMVAMAGGNAIPVNVMALIKMLPVDKQPDAQADFYADTYMYSNSLLGTLLVAAGKTQADLDAFFIAASKY